MTLQTIKFVARLTIWQFLTNVIARYSNKLCFGGIMTYEKEPENTPCIRFDEWKENLRAEQTLRRIRDIRQGFFKREDKIMLLEGLLYTRIQSGEDINDLMQALALLQENKAQDEELELKRQNNLDNQISSFIVRTFLVGVMITAMSYAISGVCGNSQSKMCVGSRVIPNYIGDVFFEPVKPSKLPAIKAID